MAFHHLKAPPMSGVMGTCYLLCFRYADGSKAWFARPHGQRAGHYQGWAVSVARRIRHHQAGNGSLLCALALAADPAVIFVVARQQPGDKNEERRLHNLGGATRRCPLCRAEKRGGIDAVRRLLTESGDWPLTTTGEGNDTDGQAAAAGRHRDRLVHAGG